MKKLLTVIIVLLIALILVFLIYFKFIFKPYPAGLVDLSSLTFPGKSGSNSGVWSGQGIKLRFTDLKTNETKDFLVEESPIGFETPFSSRTILKKSDFVGSAEIIFEKGGKKKEATLKKGDAIEFEGVKIEITGGVNSPCPPGAQC